MEKTKIFNTTSVVEDIRRKGHSIERIEDIIFFENSKNFKWDIEKVNKTMSHLKEYLEICDKKEILNLNGLINLIIKYAKYLAKTDSFYTEYFCKNNEKKLLFHSYIVYITNLFFKRYGKNKNKFGNEVDIEETIAILSILRTFEK